MHGPDITLKDAGIRFHTSGAPSISVPEAVNVARVQLNSSTNTCPFWSLLTKHDAVTTYAEYSHLMRLFFFIHLYCLNLGLLSQAVTLKPERENGLPGSNEPWVTAT